MYTLITFATQWGSNYGGINSFNADFLAAFGAAYHHSAQIICIVSPPEQVTQPANEYVTLLSLPYAPKSRLFDSSIGEIAVDLLQKRDINFDSDKTIWLGHDLITGEAAIAAARVAGGTSAVIHHMSYSDYESYAEDSESAQTKTEHQTKTLQSADLILAIGPLLRDAASDRLRGSKPVHMLIPGLAEIVPQEAPKTFVAFIGGRLSADAARIKQGHLGIAAFAAAELRARNEGGPDGLRRQPKMLLRGIDFENRLSEVSLNANHDPESELKKFAEEYAEAVINLHALPYTQNRQQLYAELSGASVALMPSWHEGFGLIAWEAIAAGVPLIIGENTGVYRLLEEKYTGAEGGYVYSLDVKGQIAFPYFRPEDLEAVVAALKAIAMDPAKARRKASTLRNKVLENNTWVSCCKEAAKAFGWDLQPGSVGDRTSQIVQEINAVPPTQTATAVEIGPLKIPQGQWRPGAGMADSQLLRAEEGLLPFDVGRAPEVEKLRKWIDDPTWPITVRLITGAGGQGKTRLAIHLCQQTRSDGWHSGLLDSNLELHRMKSLWKELRSLNQPTVIVIDYAETRQEHFLSLLKSALQNSTPQPVRILLLARDGGEWWDNLPSKDSECEALLSGYATTGPFRLPALYVDQDHRQEAFSKALRAFAEILQVPPPDIIPELIGDQLERPLFVQMAALLALYGERPLTTQGLTKALLNHERRYWVALLASFNWPDPGRRAEQLLALATLAGGFATSRMAETFWTAARDTVLSTGEFNALFRNMAMLYPGTQGLQALRPDLLGEALVAQALLRPEGDVLLDAVLGRPSIQLVRQNALTVLARMSNERTDVDEIIVTGLSRQFANCAVDVVAVSTETLSRLPELADLAFKQLSSGMKSQVAGRLTECLPEESVQLAGLICSVYEHLLERAHQRLKQKPRSFDRQVEYGRSAYNYAHTLSEIGSYKRALEVNENALLIFRRITSKDRNYEAMYSRVLGNHANYLHEMGQIQDALQYSRETFEIRKRLAQKAPDRFEPDYALSLSNYANQLRDVGQYDEALTHTHEALEIRNRLAQKNPDRFEPNYATSLNNYATHLREVDQYDEALQYARQALEIQGRLAQKNPDRFEPDYASSLHNYAGHLSDVDRDNEALQYAREALQIRKRLAQKNPDRFDPDYANSLHNYASHLGNVNRYDEALQYAREALQIRKRLAQNNLDRFEPDYAILCITTPITCVMLASTTKRLQMCVRSWRFSNDWPSKTRTDLNLITPIV